MKQKENEIDQLKKDFETKIDSKDYEVAQQISKEQEEIDNLRAELKNAISPQDFEELKHKLDDKEKENIEYAQTISNLNEEILELKSEKQDLEDNIKNLNMMLQQSATNAELDATLVNSDSYGSDETNDDEDTEFQRRKLLKKLNFNIQNDLSDVSVED